MGNIFFNSPMDNHHIWSVGIMPVEDSVIQRIIDDFDSKAAYYHRAAEKFFNDKDYEVASRIDAKSHAFEYCSMMLRMVLKSEDNHSGKASSSSPHDTAV